MPSLIPEQLDQPGTHVLVIGVSSYPHFPDGTNPTGSGELLKMKQLSAAAHSAAEFAEWMRTSYRNVAAPLSSLRVLLSPSDQEIIPQNIRDRLPQDSAATLANVKGGLIEFRERCSRFKDNVAVIYVAGHGVQLTKSGSIVLLSDCGSTQHANLLDGAIDMANVRAAFNHPDTAQTQFWFVDACRQVPRIAKRFENLEGGLRLDEPSGTARAIAWFVSATTGTKAYGRVGGRTLFCDALLWGLDNHIAAEPEPGLSDSWHVSSHSLHKSLRPRVRALAEAENAEQTVDGDVRGEDILFHEYPETPQVDFSLSLAPASAIPGSHAEVLDAQSTIVAENNQDWPMHTEIAAGMYRIRIATPQDFKDFSDICNLRPPEFSQDVDVTP